MGVRTNRSSLSKSTRRLARHMFCVEGENIPNISKELDVKERTLKDWRMKDKWVTLGKHQEKYEIVSQQLFMEEMAKRGLPPAKVFDQIRDGILCPMKDVIVGTDGKVLYAGEPDYAMREKYIKLYLDRVAPVAKGGGIINLQGGDNLTANIQIMLPPLKETKTDKPIDKPLKNTSL